MMKNACEKRKKVPLHKEYIESNDLTCLRGRLLCNVSLSKYTTYKVGGAALHLYEPVDKDDLSEFLSLLPEHEPLLWLGCGSNILVRDGGFSGTVILTKKLAKIKLIDNVTIPKAFQVATRRVRGRAAECTNEYMSSEASTQQSHSLKGEGYIYAESGARVTMLVKYALSKGLKGVEFLAGIPGTVGGALALNAGAHGNQTWNYITKVETINRYGEQNTRNADEFIAGYRNVKEIKDDSTKPQEWFSGAFFMLEHGDKMTSKKYTKEILEKRKLTQPLKYPSAGSVFRNPPGNYAARLIEACGLKGYRIGGASVSGKHANFIVNDENATATDIELLINYIMDVVEKRYDIRLVPEIHIVGGGSLCRPGMDCRDPGGMDVMYTGSPPERG